jgi:Ca2+-binding RTX toxin-like protein
MAAQRSGANDIWSGFPGFDDDILRGDNSANYLFGRAGNDRLEGRGGADTLDGGSGSDTASYESSSAGVTVYLDDSTTGTASFATGGDATGDSLISIENLVGSAHVDFLVGNSSANRLEGGAGGDGLYGGGGDDTLLGGDGNDGINGGQQNDTIDGGFGNDTLQGDQGVDTVSFESWDPTGLFSQFGETIRIDLDQGSATRTLTNPTTGVVSVAETDTLSGFENVRGSNRAETIVGNSGANVLEGRGGNDVLIGGTGNDTLDGGAGIDTANYESNAARIVVTLRDGADGSAEEHASVGGRTFVLSTDTLRGIENVRGTAFNDSITGNGDNNRLSGGNGNDTLNGGAGDDIMIGGLDNDTYHVDSAGDIVTELAGQGTDAVITTLGAYTMGANVENLTFDNVAGAGVRGYGNELNNVMTGNDASNLLDGGLGADTLTGGGGVDNFVFQAGQANGDRIIDFNGLGAATGDSLIFVGYGTIAEGATFHQLTATTFEIGSADGTIRDVITFVNAAQIEFGASADFAFVLA